MTGTRQRLLAASEQGGHTFWEQAVVAGFRVLAQEPAVAEVVVALDQLDAVAAGQAELVGAPRLEFICTR